MTQIPLHRCRLALACTLLWLLQLGSLAAEIAVPPTVTLATLSGRQVFFDNERIALCLPASGGTTTLALAIPGMQTRSLTIPAADGRAYFTLPPYTLMPGAWTLTAAGQTLPLTVVSSVPTTPFTICAYQGNPADSETWFYKLNTPGEERMRLWREEYGVNMLMLQGSAIIPSMADRLTANGMRFTTAFCLAGQHQPGSAFNDWSDPEVIDSLRYRTKHYAQWLRSYGGFAGVHFADEPGLTYGLQTPDGQMQEYVGQPIGPQDYFGPLAVKVQRDVYQQNTGKTVPDWKNPQADYATWMDFLRWRTTIIGNDFAQFTKDVHAIDPKLIGYSQVYAWYALSDGCYPPTMGAGVDVLATHAYSDFPLGMWHPAHETDAMRSGAWNKPLWMLPTWDGMSSGEGHVRAQVYSSLSRKVEGLIWPLDWAQTWPEAKEVSQRMVPISGMLAHTEKLRDPVGIFHSRDQHLYGYAQDLANNYGGRDYVGKLSCAWVMAMAAHYPATRVVEEDLVSGAVLHHKVLLVPALTYARPETIASLEAYIARGGVVFLDADATVAIHGAKKLTFAFGDWYNNTNPASPNYRKWSDRKLFEQYVLPYVNVLAAALAPYAAPAVPCDNPQLMTSLQGAGQGRYLWVVNMAQDNQDFAQGRTRLATATGTITLPEQGVIYDVFTRARVAERTTTLSLAKGDAKLYALMPDAITSVTVATSAMPSTRTTPSGLRLTGYVSGTTTPRLPAVIPLQVDIYLPQGALYRTLYRATDAKGSYTEHIPLGELAIPGIWRVTIKELLTGKRYTSTVEVTQPEQTTLATALVEIIDADRIATALSPANGEVLVLIGSPDERPTAEKLAKMLTTRRRKAKVDLATSYLTERVSTPHTMNTIAGAPLAIGKQVILLGNRQHNPLIAKLTDTYQLRPWPVTDGYPGSGRALLYWAQGMFGIDNDIIVLYADDAAGINSGVAALMAVVRQKPQPSLKRIAVK